MIYTLGELTACIKQFCQDIAELQECVAELKAAEPPVGVPSDWRCEECLAVVGYATVAQDGTVVELEGDGASITRTSTGFYNLVAPAGAVVAIPTVVEAPGTRDSIEIHMGTSFTGGTLHISEGDNGGTANIPRDRPWSITWYGKKTMVVCDTVGPADVFEPDLISLPPADGKIVSDNFQDQPFVPFNLQVRNTTGNTVDWQALVENVPYATIPNLNLNGALIQTVDNGDGTYSHMFTGESIAPFQNIIITGGVVSPSGDGSGLSLYCENF